LVLIRHRITSRVLLQANTGRFLLLLTHWSPGSGLKPRWVIPGGGIEADEALETAASRELFEETGLLLAQGDLGPKLGQLEFRQDWINGDHETGVAHIFHHKIQTEFEVSKLRWTKDEHRDILDVRWWNLAGLIESGETVGPPGLVQLMQRLSL
jgi:8-oxo-dGTP pyrophosphatase MutT (NUDIX family)